MARGRSHAKKSSTVREDTKEGGNNACTAEQSVTSKFYSVVLNFLQAVSEPVTARDVAEKLGISGAAVSLLLHQMMAEGHVCKKGGKPPYWAYNHKDEASAEQQSQQQQQQQQQLQQATNINTERITKVIKYLQETKAPAFTADLVAVAGYQSKRELNPLLYRLQQQGILKKVKDTPPLWALEEENIEKVMPDVERITAQLQASAAKALAANDMEWRNSKHDSLPFEGMEKVLEEKIVQILQTCGKQFMHATEIAKLLGFPSKKGVNPTLYRLQREGKLKKVSDSPPLWSLDGNLAQLPNGIVHENSVDGNSGSESQSSSNGIQLQEVTTVGGNFVGISGAKSKSQILNNNQSQNTAGQSKKSCTLFGNYLAENSTVCTGGNSPQCNAVEETVVLPSSDSTSETASQPSEEKDGNGLSLVLNSGSFAALVKNPISAFFEYGQQHHTAASLGIVSVEGPPHNPRFHVVAALNGKEIARGAAKTKKEAKRQAAELAVRTLVAEGKYGNNDVASVDDLANLDPPAPVSDIIAALSHFTFNQKVLAVPEYVGGRKVLAAVVMKKTVDGKGDVVCFGTGNRCIAGDNMSQEGFVVNDSHAEIITRRSFLRFLYQQLLKYNPNEENQIFEQDENSDRLKVRSDITFHLYISTAPCGDGALFAHHAKTDEREYPPDWDEQHRPLFANSLQGRLRTKLEAGEGTIPVDGDFKIQTWDAIMCGERLRTMSCSDKISRWNVIGIQGALLSLFLEPVYLTSITLGSLYHHGHLSRAVCCRLEGESDLTSLLPKPYHLNHPYLNRVSVYKPPRETEKTKAFSINWCLGDQCPELTNGETGMCHSRTEKRSSRLCKSALFQNYKDLCAKFEKNEFLGKTYGDAKLLAEEYQQAKTVFVQRYQELGRGSWIQKPPEEEMFY